jgi:hypothetical protein
MNSTAILKNETGALMILITVMLLVLLTVISIAGSRTANVETKIAANEFAYQRCFYNAEGAVMEAVDQLDTTVNPKGTLPDWMGEDSVVLNDGTVFSYWEEEAGTGTIDPGGSPVDPVDSGYMAVHLGVLPGSSLAMSKPSIHRFSIYGRCKKDGLVMLSVGYANAYR